MIVIYTPVPAVLVSNTCILYSLYMGSYCAIDQGLERVGCMGEGGIFPKTV